MSMDARGSIGKAVTATGWKGRKIIKTWFKPANPQTISQMAQRFAMAGMTRMWVQYQPSLSQFFVAMAQQNRYSEFNAFTSFNLNRWSQLLAVAGNTTPTEEAPTDNVTSIVVTPQVNKAVVSWDASVDTDAWSVYIFMKLGSAPTLSKEDLIAIVPRTVEQYVTQKQVPGTYHFKLAAGHNEGGLTALSADFTGVIG